jgi:tRNA A37 threonylcarbamoyladenosine synthetase subunit TsaC/SUA5/YrdC
MAQYFVIHPTQPATSAAAAGRTDCARRRLIVYPTIPATRSGARSANKPAIDRIRAIREVDEQHHFTLVCRDLSEIAH